jgi:hypothetical protein
MIERISMIAKGAKESSNNHPHGQTNFHVLLPSFESHCSSAEDKGAILAHQKPLELLK